MNLDLTGDIFMKQKYVFFDGGEIEFDDRKSVRDLIAFAFESFGYYEPMGMDIVTLFQAHHPDTNTGWFTTDVALSCAEEIRKPEELCFAYHLPNVFYFAEGGWGHHMAELGNHPPIDNAVALDIWFDDFRNTVVINGTYTLNDIVRVLRRTGYLGDDRYYVEVIPVGCSTKTNLIPFSDPKMKVRLIDLETILDKYDPQRIPLSEGGSVHHIELRIF